MKWQLSRGRYPEALQTAEAKSPPDAALCAQAGHEYLAHLMESKTYQDAALLCPRVLTDTAAWERWVVRF